MSYFNIPSYLDKSDGRQAFVNLANSFTFFGPLRVKPVTDGYKVTVQDGERLLRVDGGGSVYIPEDVDDLLSDDTFPVGSVIAIANASGSRLVVRPLGSVVIAGPVHKVIDRWRVGVLMKYNANFWLLSLGSGGSEGPQPPLPPVLVSAVPGSQSAILTWHAPIDDGGSPLTGYVVEKSGDGKTFQPAANVAASVLTTTLQGLQDGVPLTVRVKAVNEAGPSDPSNTLTVTPKALAAPIVTHVGTGVWNIENKDEGLIYTTQSTSGSASIAGTRVTCTGPDSVTTLTVQVTAGGPSKSVYLERKKYTYHSECTPVESYEAKGCPACPCCPGGFNCEDYGAQGRWCTRYECHDVKNATPAGYQDGFNEWFRSFYPSMADYSDGDDVSDKTTAEREELLRADPDAPDEVLLEELSDE